MSTRHDTRRRFEQWAKNPDCESNTISAVAGIEMAKIAEAEGLESSMGQSPFALARGVTFERSLFADDAKRLLEALAEAKIVSADASGLADLRLRMGGGPIKDLDTAAKETRALLQSAATAGSEGIDGLPAVIASATLTIPGKPVMLPEGKLAIDALVVRPSATEKIELVIGEIKTYPYRAGHTEAADLATSRAQAGVYLHALRLAVDELDISDRVEVAKAGFLVLSKAGRNDPAILPAEDLEFQARRAERGFERLRRAAEGLVPFDPADESVARDAVLAGKLAYKPSCLSFCDRAPGCRKRAEEGGDAVVLGEDVKRFLGAIPLQRAAELLHGAAPETPAEEDLKERLASAAEDA